MKRLLCLLASSLSAPLLAQGLWIGSGPGVPPDPGRGGGADGVRIVRTAVHAEIVDGIATTTIDQVFANGTAREAEGTWFLPLPAGAVADGFTMTVGGKEVRGEALDAGQARSIYETIVRQRRDPGLLEYAGEGLLRARIYPIPAHGEVGVTVRLRQVLAPTGGMYEWVWPLRAARLGDAAVGPLGLDVRIRSQTTLSTVVTPHANADIRRIGDREAVVSLEGDVGQFEDLRVLYGLSDQEFGLHLLAYRPGGEDGYFTLLLSPPRALAADRVPPRRFVQFVVDTSGSMAGDKIEQAKAALRTFLRSLRAGDHFQVVTFASAVTTFFPAPVPVSEENVAAAMQRIDRLQAMGGTNIAGALQQALEAGMPADDGGAMLPQIVFVTDGQPTIGVTSPQQILDLTRQLDRGAARLFALGVGDEIDVRLLDDLVLQHRGARDFVRNKEKIEVKVDALCQKLAQPALTDVEVRCDGLDAFFVHPARVRDLFCGEMLQVVGRYRDSGPRTVRVTGKQDGKVREYTFPVEFPAASEQHPFVQTVWARQHVAALLDDIRRNGAKQELVEEVRRLATRFGIVTPYTSQLIVEEGERLGNRPSPVPGSRARSGDGPITGGPGGPSVAAPSGGRSTGGPGGPSTGSPAPSLHDLGKVRTGAEAVQESLETGSDDHLGATRRASGAAGGVRDREGLVRRAGGRVFVAVGDDLVEQGLPADWSKQAVVVIAYSSEYFALLQQTPSLRDVLALGERIVFRDGARLVHVRPEPPKPPLDEKK